MRVQNSTLSQPFWVWLLLPKLERGLEQGQGFRHGVRACAGTHTHACVPSTRLVLAISFFSLVGGLVGSCISEFACGLLGEQLWLQVSKESSV